MGLKNVKEYYRIGHIVEVREEGICIGSPYIHNLITITPNLEVKWGTLGPSKGNDELMRYYSEMTGDSEKLRELVKSPDTFTASIPVFTFNGGDIIEEACEELGWPNTTHAGHIMYENTYSADKSEVVRWAKRNAALSVEAREERLSERKKAVTEMEDRLSESKGHIAKLNADYPEL